MIVYHGGEIFPASGSDINPASPGALDAQAGIAFRVCVKPLAPALSPVNPSSYVEEEWPIATLIPCDVSVLISAAESGSSGATVTSLTVDCRLEDP